MTKKEKYLSVGSVISAFVLVAVFVYYRDTKEAEGATWPGAVAAPATTSILLLDPNVATPVFGAELSGVWNPYAASTCSSRVIMTVSPININFYDGATSSAISGQAHQTASTTVTYPAEEFGCGRVTIYPLKSDGTSATVTVTEYQ